MLPRSGGGACASAPDLGQAPAHALPHGPLPRLARLTLDTLERSGFPSPAAASERAAALTEGLDHVTRARRAASILLANVPLFFALIALSIGLPTAVRLLETQFLEMSRALVEIRTLDGKTDQGVRQGAGGAGTLRGGPLRSGAGRRAHVARPALRRPADAASADRRAHSCRHSPPRRTRNAAPRTPPRRPAREPGLDPDAGGQGSPSLLPAIVLLVSAIAAVLAAFVVRGGLVLRLLGLAVATPEGAEVSRPRAAWRAAVAGSPGSNSGCSPGPTRGDRDLAGAFARWWWVPAAAAAAAVAGCARAMLHPARGAAERLTGTASVPC